MSDPEDPSWQWRALVRALVRKCGELEERVKKLEEGKTTGDARLSVQTTALVRRLVAERTPMPSEALPDAKRPRPDDTHLPHEWR